MIKMKTSDKLLLCVGFVAATAAYVGGLEPKLIFGIPALVVGTLKMIALFCNMMDE